MRENYVELPMGHCAWTITLRDGLGVPDPLHVWLDSNDNIMVNRAIPGGYKEDVKIQYTGVEDTEIFSEYMEIELFDCRNTLATGR